MKTIFASLIAVCIIAFSLVVALYLMGFFHRVSKEKFLAFLKENQYNPSISTLIQVNGERIASTHTEQILPLASTVKIIVALEFARQVEQGILDKNEVVEKELLEVYFVKHTDGGAHEAWLRTVYRKKITLHDVAKGMIHYSSNANTDYLLQRLGLTNVNKMIETLHLTNHQPIYPIVSALFISDYVQKENKLSNAEIQPYLESMSIEDYRQLSIDIHASWTENPPSDEAKKAILPTLTMPMQRIWSDRLPAASAEDYLSLMEKLNSKTYFSKEFHSIVDPILEPQMQNKLNQAWLQHAGLKGGSTAFVLTCAMYALDREGNKTEMVLLANNLTRKQQRFLQNGMNGFQLNLLKNASFRQQVKDVFEE